MIGHISKPADNQLLSKPLTATPYSQVNLAAAIGRSTVFGILSSGAQIATRFITVPVVIHHLGLDGYGIWSIIVVTAAYMRFGSAGVKSAFQKYVAEATGTGDFEAATKLLSTGSICMLLLSLMGLAPVALFSRQLASLGGVPAGFLPAAASSLTVLASIYVISNFGAVFEAIVMGGHRIDMTRKCATVLTILEALAILALLRLGYGLLAMTIVMATSELVYIAWCYAMSRRVVPQITIRAASFTKSVLLELVRFAGSYQLVNVLELLYGAIVPLMLLKDFGAGAAGVYAIAARIVSSALIVQDALVLPLLSGGTLIFASGSHERISRFFASAFRATVGAALPPLGFVSTFGAIMIVAWTGEHDSRFGVAIFLSALAGLLRAISLMQLILYRASGRALLDNVRQILRLIAILIVAHFARWLGFAGVLAGTAAAELLGVLFMLFSMSATFKAFSAKLLALDAFKMLMATAIGLGIGLAAGLTPVPAGLSDHVAAFIKLCEVTLGCLAGVWPALVLTDCLSHSERHTLLNLMLLKRRGVAAAAE